MKYSLLILIAFSFCLSSLASAADKKEMRFKGAYSGVKKASNQVITDNATWEKTWKKVHANRSPQPKLPAVDFEKQAVLAVFLGEKFTGGYGIHIASVKEEDKVVTVAVKTTSPPKGGITTQALTQPYELLVIAKSTKPVKFVVDGKEEADLATLLTGAWTHSREEDRKLKGKVYRRSDSMKFPPSRFRQRYVFNEDGTGKFMYLHPADAHRMVGCKWSISKDDPNTIHITPTQAGMGRKQMLKVIKITDDLLLVK